MNTPEFYADFRNVAFRNTGTGQPYIIAGGAAGSQAAAGVKSGDRLFGFMQNTTSGLIAAIPGTLTAGTDTITTSADTTGNNLVIFALATGG